MTQTSASPVVSSIDNWYVNPADNDSVMQQVISLCESQTGLTINAEAVGAGYDEIDQRVQAAIAAGDPPTLAMQGIANVEVLAPSDAVIDLSALLEDADSYNPASVEQFLELGRSESGKQVGVPFGVSIPVMFWNKAHFEAAGLDPESPPRTFEEVVEAAYRLSDPQSGRAGLSIDQAIPAGFSLPTIMAQAGGAMFDGGEIAFDSPEVVGLLDTLASAAEAGAVGRFADIEAENEAFTNGQSSMHIGSIATAPERAQQMSDEIGVTTIPRSEADEGEDTVYGSGSMWVMHATKPAEQEAAREILSCFLSPEAAAVPFTVRGYLPINREARELPSVEEAIDSDPLREPAIDAMDDIQRLPTFGGPDGRRAADVLVNEWMAAIRGEKGAEEALRDARTQIETLRVDFHGGSR